MTDNTIISLMKPIIQEHGLHGRGCETIDKFILILKTIELIDCDIPGIEITISSDDDSLNEGESYSDLLSGEVSHYCEKVIEGTKFINSDELESWACQFLIGENGRPNATNIALMKKNGFNVKPGEADSFGWLTGVITTKKGEIVFG